MEQEAREPAAGRSKLVRTMGWMRRTGMLYIILAMLMASCKSCNCVNNGCGDFMNQYFCFLWKKVFHCERICTVRFQLVDQSGNNITNVQPGAFAILQINSSTNPNDIFFSGTVNFNSNGTSGDLPLFQNRCIDPCNFNFAGNPFAFSIFGFLVRSSGNGCPAGQCRFWGASTTGSDITAGQQNCVLILKVRVAQGPCGPC